MKKVSLPIDSHLERIVQTMKMHSRLILTSSPGSGKTTRVPSRLAKEFGRTLVLEPRRVAVVAAAARVAEEEEWQLGNQVGYQVRLEKCWQDSSQLVFVTEAMVHQFLLRDPDLKEFAVIVLDEFHERSWQVDLALALLMKLQERRALKLVVMSATLNLAAIQNRLSPAGLVQIDEAPHELQVHFDSRPQSLVTDRKFLERVQDRIHQAMTHSQGNALVFMPGVPEIRRLHNLLLDDQRLRRYEIRQLHGGLSLAEQKELLQRRTGRVILATNVAESSLTIPEVDVVVDTGLEKTSLREAGSPFQELRLQRISLFSARQRAGRAARERAGHCFRMWAEKEERGFAAEVKPRIFLGTPGEMVLLCAALGFVNLRDLPWLEEPHVGEWQNWLQLFRDQGHIDLHDKLTARGRRTLQLPLDFALASLVVTFGEAGRADFAAVLAQFLQDGEPRFLRSRSEQKTDFAERLSEVARLWRANDHDPWVRGARGLSSTLRFEVTDADLELLIAVWPDRVGRWRKNSFDRGILSQGRGVFLDRFEKPTRDEFFICLRGIDGLEPSESQMSWHFGVAKELLVKATKGELTEQNEFAFYSESGKVVARAGRYWRKLPIDLATERQVKMNEIPRTETAILSSVWDFLIRKNETLVDFLSRVQWLAELIKEGLPKAAGGNWLQDLQELLPMWTDEFQEMLWGSSLTVQELVTMDFSAWLESLFSRSLWLDLQRNLPSRLHHRHRSFAISYSAGRAPEVEAKIQDFFGLTKHPTIMDGAVPLRIVLLGPHRRPVQITLSIVDFWRGSYVDVRKDLRARYPKHKWPEDPLAEFNEEGE